MESLVEFTPECEQIKRVEYDTRLTINRLEQWAKIPHFTNDPLNPEWSCTPLTPLDLTSLGYGVVHIKREDKNPTGTIKDRPAWEHVTLFRDMALLYLRMYEQGKISNTEIEQQLMPHLSVITSGNEGRALASAFAQYNLPPPNLLTGAIPIEYEAELLQVKANIFRTSLGGKALTRTDIIRLTNNKNGTDISGNMSLEPHKVYYDWLVHEIFNAEPTHIFLPFGSGRLMENFLYWQNRTSRNYFAKHPDPRLQVTVDQVMAINIIAGEPMVQESAANKLTAPFKPFRIYSDEDIDFYRKSPFSGSNSTKEGVLEPYIEQAYNSMCFANIPSEPSSSTGLALYMQQYDRYRYSAKNPLQSGKIVIINTGCGIAHHIESSRIHINQHVQDCTMVKI